MLNQYPLWKNTLIALVLIIGGLYALPNLFGEDPAIQISPAHIEATVDVALLERVETALAARDLTPIGATLDAERLLLRFADTDDQLKAQDVLRAELQSAYVAALNLAPRTPAWLRALDAAPMNLGLDLRGGVHFLMAVDMNAAIAQAYDRYAGDLRALLRGEKVRYLSIDHSRSGVVIAFREPADQQRAYGLIRDEFQDLQVQTVADDRLLAQLSDAEARQVRDFALQQNITTLRNRVNELGVAEPLIQQQGRERIVVQLPGVQDTARAKEILGATATLNFRHVDYGPFTPEAQAAAASGRAKPGARLFVDRGGQPYLLKSRTIITGDQIVDAASGLDQQSGSPAVFITLDGKGASKMSKETRDRIGKQMAVVFIETKTDVTRDPTTGELRRDKRQEERVINAAVIRDQLSKRFQITGLDSTREARDLALLLRAGALAAPVDIIEERTVGPSMGQENIDQGMRSVVIGMVLVLVFMALYYRLFGLVANLALLANLVMIVAVLSLFQATLTLPGIAGIVLTVGMAVDANVLIFERIREEIALGNTPQAAIHSGYQKAFATIADANVTTLIAAIVLFGFGTGPIKGFAVTLSIGIITSMFTAILGTRAIINKFYGRKRVNSLAI